MIPLGYMLKRVVSPAPEWIGAPAVTHVHSVSGCVSACFMDYVPLWKHNGWWLFDTAAGVQAAAEEQGIDLEPLSLFYYEGQGEEYDEDAQSWRSVDPEQDLPTCVEPPSSAVLRGFDVVTFSVGTLPECSPLSCNGLAASIPVNAQCLFDSFEQAREAVESGRFRNSEPGPFRIFAVYEVEPVA